VKLINSAKIYFFIFFISTFLIFSQCEQIVEDWEVNHLTDDFIQFYAKSFPIEASLMGIHKYDNRLDNYNFENIEQIINQLNIFSDRLSLVDTSSISFNSRVNYFIVKKQVNYLFLELNEWKRWKYDSHFYVRKLFDAFDALLCQSSDSLNVVPEKILGRVKMAPEFLNNARDNLTTIDPINIDCALDQIEILKNRVAFQISKVQVFNSSLLDSLNYYSEIMFDSLDSFQGFLTNTKNKIQPVSNPLNTQLYQSLLTELLEEDIQLDSLIKTVEKDYQNTVRKMAAIARYYFKEQDKSYENIGDVKLCKLMIDEINKDVPRKDQIIPLCREMDNYYKRFIDEIAFLSLPIDYSISISWRRTDRMFPEKLIKLVPVGLMGDDISFAIRLKPIPNDEEWIAQLSLLRNYNKASLKAAMLLDGFPIHYNYWFKMRKKLPGAVKTFPEQTILAGLPFNFASALIELGLGGFDPMLEFSLLENYAKTIFFALVELKYYFLQYSQGQVDSLFKVSKLFNLNQSKEAFKEYNCFPGQNLLTYWGIRQLKQIEETCHKIKKRKFNKREFYKYVLQQGPIPVKLLEEKLYNH